MAENEFQTLGKYYVQTDEFNRAIRGEVNLVVGRKGTGKTALFSQVRDKKRGNKNNIVVDLKPEGYQLVKLKEDVLDYLSCRRKAAFGYRTLGVPSIRGNMLQGARERSDTPS